jgi:hypothetical protein
MEVRVKGLKKDKEEASTFSLQTNDMNELMFKIEQRFGIHSGRMRFMFRADRLYGPIPE